MATLTEKITTALTALKHGKLILVADDTNREAEGDLIGLASLATPDSVNTMTKYGRGLICVPMTVAKAAQLNLSLMTMENTEHFHTAFTVSVDERHTSTGISAYERATTIRRLGQVDATEADFERPGHIFPLIAREGGVLVRRGHTEAAVDLARLVGEEPATAYICETLTSDGHMRRLPELKQLAKELGIPLITIDDLARYRYLINDSAVTGDVRVKLPTQYGEFTLTDYESATDKRLQLLLHSTKANATDIPLVRLHSECFTGDVLGSKRCDCGQQLTTAMTKIGAEGGYLLYLRQEGRGIGLKNKLRAYQLQEQGLDTVEANEHLGFEPDERDYGIAAAMLHDQGVDRIRLMTNNPDKIAGLQKYGIEVVERVPLEVSVYAEDHDYLRTKQFKFHHALHVD
ncbi:MAG: GTP cyclohydrolase II [Furfurilactobacillus sp.]|jgi:3,4-dihydroxy 2-butanone 4-phosphate synthase/GTP cyclohydrolase II|uniref:GTP cyclohydrolase II n=1 Tax=Furfurilactobacillus TaxID=2767882 RepID=UPI001EEF50AE|nr:MULTISPECIES: GTP cyclohydrolase II [Furfurilactobacillus]MCF6418472.1 GTP cyclohydrolase II [Furfurilactobacillus milii]MCH4011978.1 GTP cyclohydrolase II [Furfurilactobacillus sp.]MCH4037870.1 GTP cyclohydrolase II [Furfurilactobacillus sp.]MCH4115493.1 GTP cyclohydrolase II [Furfurilactobacillus sp.]MCI1341083.1 GTP cyclohydrolase II [Furfurilactobacillus sp.]